jgi:hypothetical protein
MIRRLLAGLLLLPAVAVLAQTAGGLPAITSAPGPAAARLTR